MAAAETIKTTVEQFTAASNQAFKDGVEKSLAALAEANTHSKKNLEAVVASVTAATCGSMTAQVSGQQSGPHWPMAAGCLPTPKMGM